MPRRTYDSRRPIAPLPLIEREPIVMGALPCWEDGQLLHDIKPAAAILTAKLGRGYSARKLRERIKNGVWVEGYHWLKTEGCYKLSIPRVIEWQSGSKC